MVSSCVRRFAAVHGCPWTIRGKVPVRTAADEGRRPSRSSSAALPRCASLSVPGVSPARHAHPEPVTVAAAATTRRPHDRVEVSTADIGHKAIRSRQVGDLEVHQGRHPEALPRVDRQLRLLPVRPRRSHAPASTERRRVPHRSRQGRRRRGPRQGAFASHSVPARSSPLPRGCPTCDYLARHEPAQ